MLISPVKYLLQAYNLHKLSKQVKKNNNEIRQARVNKKAIVQAKVAEVASKITKDGSDRRSSPIHACQKRIRDIVPVIFTEEDLKRLLPELQGELATIPEQNGSLPKPPREPLPELSEGQYFEEFGRYSYELDEDIPEIPIGATHYSISSYSNIPKSPRGSLPELPEGQYFDGYIPQLDQGFDRYNYELDEDIPEVPIGATHYSRSSYSNIPKPPRGSLPELPEGQYFEEFGRYSYELDEDIPEVPIGAMHYSRSSSSAVNHSSCQAIQVCRVACRVLNTPKEKEPPIMKNDKKTGYIFPDKFHPLSLSIEELGKMVDFV